MTPDVSSTKSRRESLRPGAFRLGPPGLQLLVLACSILATWFLTIQSIRIELAAKAEAAVVATLDKKLGAFEVFLKEGVVGKEEFYRFSREVDGRLARIEYHLSDQRERRGN